MRPRTVLVILLVALLLLAPKVVTSALEQSSATAKQSVCGAVR
jgi:hypothetical protein